MRIRQRTTAWLRIPLFIIFVLIPVLAAAQPRARLIGKIVDESGKPIPDVSVTATSPQLPTFKQTLKTDKRGTFLIDFDEVNVTYHYRFEKAGYETVDVDQNWQLEGTQHFEWKMAPATVQVAAAGGAAVTMAPGVVDAYNAGVTAANAKDWATAETKLKEAVQADPKLARGWAMLASAEVQTGHNQEALDATDKAIALGLKDETVLTARWQAYKNLKDDVKAAEAQKELEAAGKATEQAKKLHNEAVALVKAGDNAGALAKFEDALKIDPSLEASQLGLATAALALGRNEEAATAAESVLKTDPKNEQALRLRYNACLKLGDKQRLYDALVGLAQVEPTVAGKGVLALAFEAYDANDSQTAKARFQKALEIDPNQPLAYYYLGMAYVSEGDNAKARSYLEKFVAMAPTSNEAATARDILKQLPK